MVRFNYCPQCATAKIGRFCAGCGVNLEEITALFASLATTPTTAGAAYAALEPDIPVVDMPPSGLVYGESYDPDNDCANCGSPLQGDECSLCRGG